MLQDRFVAHRARGFVLLTALQGATQEEAAAWASTYSAPHPVVSDADKGFYDALDERSTTYPSYVLVDPELQVRKVRIGPTDAAWFDLYVPGLQDERDANK